MNSASHLRPRGARPGRGARCGATPAPIAVALCLAPLLALTALVVLPSTAAALGVHLFHDSPRPDQWESSWGYAASGSQLELVDVSHFPVDTMRAFIGANALRLHWTSAAGGDWMLTAATRSWIPFDTTPLDSIVFAAWSDQAIAGEDLPDFLLEDANNTRTPRHPLSNYVAGIPAATWTRVSVPLSVFRANPGGADLTRLNKVFFAQGPSNAPGSSHTMLVDEIRFVSAGLVTPAAPVVSMRAFERHAEVRWDPEANPDAETMRIEHLVGGNWLSLGDAPAADGAFVDWLGAGGGSETCRAVALGWNFDASPASASAAATTHEMTDDEWFDMAEEAAFRYFFHGAHPTYGLARDRYTGGDLISTGGTGMGLMALVAGAARGYAPRARLAARVRQILEFYATIATPYHGAFSHYLNGTTGASVSADSDGLMRGDIVETSYLIQGALTARRYFDGTVPDEVAIRSLADQLWQGVDWNAYRMTPDAIYWLWGPTAGWTLSFPVAGWNECMIVYLLAIASPTHPVPASCWYQGWSRYGAMVNGNSYYGYTLPLGSAYGGPLFFAHYSFMGFDPRGRRDPYANYVEQNRNHTLINRAYCAANPNQRAGFSADIWGLTACDGPSSYVVNSPWNEEGTLAPTASLSSTPWTPQESLDALRAMYRLYGRWLYGPFGFRDAFNPGLQWFDPDYIAIDEGPIAVMIENFRSRLVWNLFMSNPEIQPALDAIGFVEDATVDVAPDAPRAVAALGPPVCRPNPCRGAAELAFELPAAGHVRLTLLDVQGREVARLVDGERAAGRHAAHWDGRDATVHRSRRESTSHDSRRPGPRPSPGCWCSDRRDRRHRRRQKHGSGRTPGVIELRFLLEEPMRFFSAALAAIAILSALPGPAHAVGVPYAPNCLVPSHIDLVGINGTTDPAGTFFVNVRDIDGVVIPAATVQIDFGQCSDVVLSAAQPYSGLLVSCVTSTVSATTDGAGTAVFSIAGGIADRTAVSPVGCAEIYANGILIGSVSVAAFDQDGIDGVTTNDLALWLCDLSTPAYEPRSDFDHDGVVSPADLRFMLSVLRIGGSTTSGLRCDGQSQQGPVDYTSGTLVLRWNGCDPLGDKVETFACDVEGGASELIGSIIAGADVTISGYEARIEVEGDVPGPLVDWWRYDDIGCRGANALGLDLDVSGSTCNPPWAGSAPTGIAWMPEVLGGGNTAQLYLAAADSLPHALVAGEEYALFRLRFPHTGLAACAGCLAPIVFTMDEVRLTQWKGCQQPPFIGAFPRTQVLDTPRAFESNVAVYQGAPSGVTVDVPSPQPQATQALHAQPNPFRASVAFPFVLEDDATLAVEVFDVTGRVVRTLDAGFRRAGSHRVEWDGLDGAGRRVPAGVYLIRLRAGDDVRWAKTVRWE